MLPGLPKPSMFLWVQVFPSYSHTSHPVAWFAVPAYSFSSNVAILAIPLFPASPKPGWSFTFVQPPAPFIHTWHPFSLATAAYRAPSYSTSGPAAVFSGPAPNPPPADISHEPT